MRRKVKSVFANPSKRVLKPLALLLIISLACAWLSSHAIQTVEAAAGDLDPTFGNAGRVVTSFPGGLDTANDIAVQSDGKIVVAGSSGSDFAVVRYNTNGTLDVTFGVGGRVRVRLG